MPVSRIALVAFCLMIGAALAGFAFFFVGKAEAQRQIGSYTIREHSNPNAIAGVFRLNQATGYISYCYVNSTGKIAVTCTPEIP